MNIDALSNCQLVISRDQPLDLSVIDEILFYVSKRPEVADATWHPLGFIRLKLASTAQGTVRVHIWPAKDREPQLPLWSIHDHLFDVRSSILCGVLENHRFAVASDGSPATHRLYEVSYRMNESQLHATTSEVSCHHLSTDVCSPLDSYQVCREEFHASVVKEDILAATIVVTSNHSERPPNVLGDLSAAQRYTYERRRCAPDYVSKLASLVRFELGAAAARGV
jgi:hypothetical protein